VEIDKAKSGEYSVRVSLSDLAITPLADFVDISGHGMSSIGSQ
jgi:hypothetical protein